MRFIILGAAIIAAASAIMAQIDPITGQIVNPLDWLNGILVSKRLDINWDMLQPSFDAPSKEQLAGVLVKRRIMAPIEDPLSPTDWLNGILVSKRRIVSTDVNPIDWISGVLVSKRIMAPIYPIDPLNPLDWINGVLVSKRIIAMPIDPLDPLPWLTGVLVSKRVVAAPINPNDPYDWLTGILVSKREDFLPLVTQAQDIIDLFYNSFQLQDKREVMDALNFVLQYLTKRGAFEDAVDSLTSLTKRGAFEDAVDSLTSLTKKDAIASLVKV